MDLVKSAALRSQLAKTFGIEEVYVVPSFDTDEIPNGFTHKKKVDAKNIHMNLANAKFVLRSDAEQDNVFKQIIPMTVIKDSYQNYFVLERKKPSKDTRLKAPFSILIGGHINPIDGYADNFEKCMKRHLQTATTFKTIPYFGRSFYGYVKDEASELSDHIGYIYFTTVTNCYKSYLEAKPSAGKGSWMSKDKLMKYYNYFNAWDRLIISHIVYGDERDRYEWKHPQTKLPQQQAGQNL